MGGDRKGGEGSGEDTTRGDREGVTTGDQGAGGDSARGDSAGGDSARGDSAGGDSAGGESAGGDRASAIHKGIRTLYVGQDEYAIVSTTDGYVDCVVVVGPHMESGHW